MSGSAGKRSKGGGGGGGKSNELSAIFQMEEEQSSGNESGGSNRTVTAMPPPPVGHKFSGRPSLGDNEDFFFSDETGIPPRAHLAQQLFGTVERPVVVHQHTDTVPRIVHRYIGERGEPVEEIIQVPVPGWTNNGGGGGGGGGGGNGAVLRGLMGSGMAYLAGLFTGVLIDRHFVVMVLQTALLAVIVMILLGVWLARRR